MSKKLLVISANHWTSPYHVGTHSLTTEFVKNGWEAAFISDPLSPFHLLNRDDELVKERFRIFREGGRYYEDGKLWTYVPFTLAPPHKYPVLRSSFVYNNWNSLTCPDAVRHIKRSGFGKVDLIMTDNSRQLYLLDKIEYKKAIFRITDNYKAAGKFTHNAFEGDKKLAAKADLVIYTSKQLKSYAEELGAVNPVYFPNGVDYGHFSSEAGKKPEEYFNLKGPIAVYAGETRERFDAEAVKYAAEALPDFNFVVIGERGPVEETLGGIRNVILTGTKSFEELPSYFQYADIGIIPFRVKELGELINYVNPLKMYQYFAAGLQVVTSSWQTLDELNPPAFTFNSFEKFAKQLKLAYNKPIDKEVITEFARKNDWKNRYKELESLIGI